jgi:capsular polysaccharide biosynthesis protein
VNARVLARRLRRRVPRELLRVVGEPVNGVSAVDTTNPETFARRYGTAVRCWSHIDDAGVTALVPKHVEPAGVPGLSPFHDMCESVVLEIEDPSFSLRSHVLLDGERRVVYSDSEPAAGVTRFRSHVSRRVRRLPGTVAYLSNLWVDNYYHWMQLTLPLLRFYRDVWQGAGIDHYYVGPSNLHRVQEETLIRAGIDPARIVREPCRADRIVSAVYVHREQHGGGLRYRDGWGHRFTRDLFGELHTEGAQRRIYVERGLVRNRRLRNEDALVAFLAGYGFQRMTMDGMSVSEQARLFANAEAVVGVHGAALTNLVFAAPGTRVVEIFPPGVLEVSYFAAATHSALDYLYVLGEPGEQRNADFAVDIDKMARLFDAFSI